MQPSKTTPQHLNRGFSCFQLEFSSRLLFLGLGLGSLLALFVLLLVCAGLGSFFLFLLLLRLVRVCCGFVLVLCLRCRCRRVALLEVGDQVIKVELSCLSRLRLLLGLLARSNTLRFGGRT